MRSSLIVVTDLAGELCSQGGGPLIGDRGVAIEKRSQRILLILSAAIPGQSGSCTFFKRSAHSGERLIFLPPVNMARGPPFFMGSRSVKKLNARPGNALCYTALGKEV